MQKRSLGRGLSDLGLNELLLGDLEQAHTQSATSVQAKTLPLDSIHPGRYQPRRQMDPEKLTELADSIRAQGIIQPILVRRDATGYEIIAGERRWRAAQLAGLSEIPVIVRDLPDTVVSAMALIENIQRQDLNALEEAMAMQRLMDEFHMTHQAVAEAVGKSRVSVTNCLRLLKLNTDTRDLLERGLLEMGHARALLALEGVIQSDVAKRVVARSLSVRDTENLIRHMQTNAEKKENIARINTIDPDVARLQTELSDKLAATVFIRHQNNGKGKLIIYYNNLDELTGILDHIQ